MLRAKQIVDRQLEELVPEVHHGPFQIAEAIESVAPDRTRNAPIWAAVGGTYTRYAHSKCADKLSI